MSRKRSTLAAAALFLLVAGQSLAGQAFTQDGLLSHYAVPRAVAPIAVDGRLDEFAWETAEQINGFSRILNEYGQILHPTRAKMLWDDENLYFAFACQDPDIWAIFGQRDDALWEEEVVEVFIDPDGDGRDYLELEVNPLNTVVDLRIRGLEPAWDSSIPWDIRGLQSAVQVYGTVSDSASSDLGWSVEIAIPWSAMADSIGGGHRPAPGDTWRLNLYRIERRGGRNLMLRIRELEKQCHPFNARIAQVLQASGAASEKELSAGAREQVSGIRREMEPLTQELEPLQKLYNEQTEYTAWSPTYKRGFHHPARFGVVQFAK
jgi:hypothetical protein